MNFKLIVFDWDGTLMDSEARIVDCMQRALGDLGIPPEPPEHIRNIIGLGLLEAIRRLLPDIDHSTQAAIKDAYRRHYLGADGSPTPMFPGADRVVRELEQADFLLAVATGKGRSGLDKAMRESGIGDCFHATRCADETFSKPHPQMLEELMDQLGVMPEQTLMIGDTEYDMQLAKNARAHALAVSYGVHGRDRLLAQTPLDCVDDVREIPGWIEARCRPSAA